MWRQHHRAALRLRVNPSHEIPPAYYLSFPPTVDEAAMFSANASRAQRAEALARETAARLDALGAPTAAGAYRVGPTARRVVWTTRARARQCERSVLLLTKLLVMQFIHRERGDSIGAAIEAIVGEHVAHNFWWGAAPVSATAVGALAWRALRERDERMPATTKECGAKLYVRVPNTPLTELASPFEPLLELLGLGVQLVAIGDEAVAIELAT
jgi:hypothetical protein